MKLSILDQSVAIANKCQDQVINDTLNLSIIANSTKMPLAKFTILQ